MITTVNNTTIRSRAKLRSSKLRNMKKVDFFIVGAQKAGTTSLYKYLAQHPDVFMPRVKEIHYFAEERYYKKGENYFNQFYEEYAGEKLKGGAYVHLFSATEAPKRIYEYNKDAKILIMLRNPIDRAYSAYHFALKNGWELTDNAFVDTLSLQQNRMNGNFTERTDLSYFEVGLYYKHITNWLQWFPKEQVFVLFDTDLKASDQEPVKRLFNYLGIADNVQVNTSVVHNKSGDVKFKRLHYFIRNKELNFKKVLGSLLPFKLRYFLRTRVRKSIDKYNMVEKTYAKLTTDERTKVFAYFEEDVKKLSALLQKDLVRLWKPGSTQ